MFLKKYQVIVVGGGHAGCEAASCTARLGLNTLLITMNLQTIGQMSCNPAMGGIAKGQIIREIDALGGYSGIITDNSMIQFRMLNRSKGPAMWSPRAQCDRNLFAKQWRINLEKIPLLDFFQEEVTSLIIKNFIVYGIKTSRGISIKSDIVILTNGTFLNGLIHIGEKKILGGRLSDNYSSNITKQLKGLGFVSGRMKTGTSPRIDGRSLNFNKMTEQIGDHNPEQFSFIKLKNKLNVQKSCYITYTNSIVHNIIKKSLTKSPMFNGSIKSIGPRYCPSIEDKIYKFYHNTHHQIFVEPEGLDTIEMYVNGFSTSLPEEIQYEALKNIAGFENVKMFKPGYAIEYDYFPPIQLTHSLETKIVKNLFFAGQINGTTGYEEAAAQGLISGINAYMNIKKLSPFILKRNEAYIGVLINDLVNKNIDEPYRMFTSNAEYRILLRQDNADIRLTHLGYKIGLINKERLQLVEYNKSQIKKCIQFFNKEFIEPNDINNILIKKNENTILEKTKISKILSRPNISINDIINISKINLYIKNLNRQNLNQVSILIKYKGYLLKEKENAKKLLYLENIIIPNWIKYQNISSLSSEAREKLIIHKPRSIGDANRINGISPSDINILLIYMKR